MGLILFPAAPPDQELLLHPPKAKKQLHRATAAFASSSKSSWGQNVHGTWVEMKFICLWTSLKPHSPVIPWAVGLEEAHRAHSQKDRPGLSPATQMFTQADHKPIGFSWSVKGNDLVRPEQNSTLGKSLISLSWGFSAEFNQPCPLLL